MIGMISPKFLKYIVGAITLAKKISIPLLKKGKRVFQWIKKTFGHSKKLALKVSQIHDWRLNQKKLASIKNLGVGERKKKGNKVYGRNKWKPQMPPTHPPI